MSMMLFASMACLSETKAENTTYQMDVGSVGVATLDVQAYVSNVAFKAVQINIASFPMEYNVLDVPIFVADFGNVGLKPYDTLIPSKRIITLNYFAGKYNTKYRYQCSCLQSDVSINKRCGNLRPCV